MSRNKVKSVRLKYLINPPFQMRFILYTVISSVVSISIAYCANCYFFWKFRELGLIYKIPFDHVFYVFLAKQEVMMNWIFVLAAALIYIFLLVFGLIFSHRIAGPLVKLTYYLNSVENYSQLKEIKFRKNDFFQEIATSYNKMVAALKPK